MHLCKWQKFAAIVTLVVFVFSGAPCLNGPISSPVNGFRLSQSSALAPVCSASSTADSALSDVRSESGIVVPAAVAKPKSRAAGAKTVKPDRKQAMEDFWFDLRYNFRANKRKIFTVAVVIVAAVLLLFPGRTLLTDLLTPEPTPTPVVEEVKTRKPDWTDPERGMAGYWVAKDKTLACEMVTYISSVTVIPTRTSGTIRVESPFLLENPEWEGQRFGVEVSFSQADINEQGKVIIDLAGIFDENPGFKDTVYQLVALDGLELEYVSTNGHVEKVPVEDSDIVPGEELPTESLPEDAAVDTAEMLSELKDEAYTGFTLHPTNLSSADIATWWTMSGDPDNNGFLAHPVWLGKEGMTVDRYASSESVSYQLLTAYNGYVMSGGQASYAELIKSALTSHAHALDISGKTGFQMPWLVDAAADRPVDANSAADGDALVLATLQRMRDEGVFKDAAFSGWTFDVHGKSYASVDEFVSALLADYTATEVHDAAPAGAEPFYVVGVSDGSADPDWPSRKTGDGRTLVMVNTSYNVWVDPEGDEKLEQAQINLLRAILATQTWNLDGSAGTRSDASMGAFPGWTDVSGTGAPFSMDSQIERQEVTVGGRTFSFWNLEQSSAGFGLSQERLAEKGLVSFQNYEGHRMLVFAVDLEQRLYEKQLAFEKTGDAAYALTPGEIEAYRLTACILENYMNFQKIVLLTQGQDAMANDAYYITDSDYGELGNPGTKSVPGFAHAFATGTKAGTVSAHLMAAMAVGDEELTALYGAQLSRALGLLDAAFDKVERAHPNNPDPLYAYGKDGSSVSFELGNYYFEGAFVIDLLASYPTCVMPSPEGLTDPELRLDVNTPADASEPIGKTGVDSNLPVAAAAVGGNTMFGLAGIVAYGDSGRRKARRGSAVFGGRHGVGGMFPPERNVLAMPDEMLYWHVAQTPYFMVGKGARLRPSERGRRIREVVAQIRMQIQKLVMARLAEDPRAEEECFLFADMADVIVNVPKAVVRYLFAYSRAGLFVMLSPDMIAEMAAELGKSA